MNDRAGGQYAPEWFGSGAAAGSDPPATAASITRHLAREALQNLAAGVPPPEEVEEFISVGLEHDLEILDHEYFGPDALLPNSTQGTFKLIEAYYGGGKTHYLRSVVRLATKRGFASAFIELNQSSCPLDRLDLVYIEVARKLSVVLPNKRFVRGGLGEVIWEWATSPEIVEDEVDRRIEYAHEQVARVRTLPVQSLRKALDAAAIAFASLDQSTWDDALVYLQGGKVSPALRKRGVLEAIDAKNASRALSSIAIWLRSIGCPGLVLVMDEGDRSLSLQSSKNQRIAANNLVHLINEASAGQSWPGVMFLYSIPSWDAFNNAMGSDNPALTQRVKGTGFPDVPPAPRIVLDNRYTSVESKLQFCQNLGARLALVFGMANPGTAAVAAESAGLAHLVAKAAVERVQEVHFIRTFIKVFVSALYVTSQGRRVSPADIDRILQE